VQNVRGIVRATHIQNWREISKFLSSELKEKRLDPRRPYVLGVSNDFVIGMGIYTIQGEHDLQK
jgi:hypothetical protein